METNVTVNCVHPGIVRTRLTREREGFATGVKIYNNTILLICLCFWLISADQFWVLDDEDLVFLLASKLLKTIPQVLIL